MYSVSIAIMLSVAIFIVMLNVIMLNVIKLNVIILNDIMLNVVAHSASCFILGWRISVMML
jgi:hypothetical protein